MGDVAQQPQPGPGPVPTSPCSPGHSLLWDWQSWKEERTMLATSELSVPASVGVMAQGLGWGRPEGADRAGQGSWGRPEGADRAGQGSWGEDCSLRSLRAQCRGEGPWSQSRAVFCICRGDLRSTCSLPPSPEPPGARGGQARTLDRTLAVPPPTGRLEAAEGRRRSGGGGRHLEIWPLRQGQPAVVWGPPGQSRSDPCTRTSPRGARAPSHCGSLRGQNPLIQCLPPSPGWSGALPTLGSPDVSHWARPLRSRGGRSRAGHGLGWGLLSLRSLSNLCLLFLMNNLAVRITVKSSSASLPKSLRADTRRPGSF